MTQRKLPLNHPLLRWVQAGGNPSEACIALLRSAELHRLGQSEGRLKIDGEESRAVLRTMNDFHRTWFYKNNFSTIAPSTHSHEIHDTGEPALHVTRALLTPEVPFKWVLTGMSGVEAVRTSPAEANLSRPISPKNRQFVRGAAADGSLNYLPIEGQLVAMGELVGVKRFILNPDKINMRTLSAETKYPKTIQIHASRGGGILGTASYLALNLGLRPDQIANGTLVMAREWSKSVFRDFFCRSLPVVRYDDAAPYVDKRANHEVPPFRKSQSCMACHASIDPLASVVRNFSPVITPRSMFFSVQDVRGLASYHLYEWTVTQGAETRRWEADAMFHRRPSKGELFYRDYRGNPQRYEVSKLSELGAAISQSDDFYVCAASRYFQFFTGVQVSLQDPGDRYSPTLSESEQEYLEIVVRLGLNLKKHQKLQNLVQEIIELPLYQRNAMRLEKDDFSGGD